MSAPYDPTRQTYSNDLGRADEKPRQRPRNPCRCGTFERGHHEYDERRMPIGAHWGDYCEQRGIIWRKGSPMPGAWASAPTAKRGRACQACGLTDPGPVFCRWCNALLDE